MHMTSPIETERAPSPCGTPDACQAAILLVAVPSASGQGARTMRQTSAVVLFTDSVQLLMSRPLKPATIFSLVGVRNLGGSQTVAFPSALTIFRLSPDAPSRKFSIACEGLFMDDGNDGACWPREEFAGQQGRYGKILAGTDQHEH